MADNRTVEQRRYNMQQVRSKNTKPEIIVRKILFSKGFRYRLHSKKLPGKPDIVLKKYKTAIFVHGCFWHGHNYCKYAKTPVTNFEFWQEKILLNKKRDKMNTIDLLKLGWKVIVIWECELNKNNFNNRINEVIVELISNKI